MTDRGSAIARVLPIDGERTIDRLIRERRVTPAKRRRRTPPTPLETTGTVSHLIAEQRRCSPTSTPQPSSRCSSGGRQITVRKIWLGADRLASVP